MEIQNFKIWEARIVSNDLPTYFVQHLIASKNMSFAPYTTVKKLELWLVNITYITFKNIIYYTIN